MALAGFRGRVPALSPAPAFGLLGEVADELAGVTRAVGREVRADPAELLTIRSGLRGLTRQGQVSIDGLARLVRTVDGWCAVTLSRDTDVTAVPAILGVLGADAPGQIPDADAAWAAIEPVARVTPASKLAEAAQLLGVAAAALAGPPTRESAPWPPWRARRIAEAGPVAPSPAGRLDGAVVADLSTMWAGPLCARLLRLARARVRT